MDVGTLIPFLVLIITILGGFWKVYALLDAKIERLREVLVKALANEMGTSRSDITAIRERIDRYVDREKK